jgi:hypothetical protein
LINKSVKLIPAATLFLGNHKHFKIFGGQFAGSGKCAGFLHQISQFF